MLRARKYFTIHCIGTIIRTTKRSKVGFGASPTQRIYTCAVAHCQLTMECKSHETGLECPPSFSFILMLPYGEPSCRSSQLEKPSEEICPLPRFRTLYRVEPMHEILFQTSPEMIAECECNYIHGILFGIIRLYGDC
jgi:hypothetical protein